MPWRRHRNPVDQERHRDEQGDGKTEEHDDEDGGQPDTPRLPQGLRIYVHIRTSETSRRSLLRATGPRALLRSSSRAHLDVAGQEVVDAGAWPGVRGTGLAAAG